MERLSVSLGKHTSDETLPGWAMAIKSQVIRCLTLFAFLMLTLPATSRAFITETSLIPFDLAAANASCNECALWQGEYS